MNIFSDAALHHSHDLMEFFFTRRHVPRNRWIGQMLQYDTKFGKTHSKSLEKCVDPILQTDTCSFGCRWIIRVVFVPNIYRSSVEPSCWWEPACLRGELVENGSLRQQLFLQRSWGFPAGKLRSSASNKTSLTDATFLFSSIILMIIHCFSVSCNHGTHRWICSCTCWLPWW